MNSIKMDCLNLVSLKTIINILLTASNNQFRNESEFSQFFGHCLTTFTSFASFLFLFVIAFYSQKQYYWLAIFVEIPDL